MDNRNEIKYSSLFDFTTTAINRKIEVGGGGVNVINLTVNIQRIYQIFLTLQYYL
jgi:hypothetical protein